MKITKAQLLKIEKAKLRREMIKAGAYDGRFRQRAIKDKRFNKPKHKLNYTEDDGN